eukprot:XP_011450302.1 PREDICTED: uncharacterized protein LOC105344260 isoform X1 [Crassostrea gigas]
MDCMMNVGSLLLYVVMHIIIMQDESRVTAFLPLVVTSVTIFYIQYGPCTVSDLKQGDVRLWCACGLSKKQPWCDGSHKGTGIKPLRWKVSKEQRLFQICACKYTKDPPFCDATHTNLPCQVLQRQEACPWQQDSHNSNSKLCTGCGWVPDF